ncbi:MAG: hypothetical protein LBB24_00160 [Rickettsiales bacterium]|nr:hypothetical protein [Rickettsiales bacterium]
MKFFRKELCVILITLLPIFSEAKASAKISKELKYKFWLIGNKLQLFDENHTVVLDVSDSHKPYVLRVSGDSNTGSLTVKKLNIFENKTGVKSGIDPLTILSIGTKK